MDLLRTPRLRRREAQRRGLEAAHAASRSEARVGDTVVAQDGTLGEVERVIRTETRAPAYVVVAVGRLAGRRYPIVPWSLVTGVDRSRARIHVSGRRRSISRLSETLPLVV